HHPIAVANPCIVQQREYWHDEAGKTSARRPHAQCSMLHSQWGESMRELTPLDRVTAIDPATRQKLADYWIESVEEFVSTARASNQQFQNGRTALAVALGIGEEQLKTMLDEAMSLLPEDVSF